MIEMEQCPSCHIAGRRKTFARYEDGHGYCFYCSFYEKGNVIKQMEQGNRTNEFYSYPSDSTNTVSGVGMEWLRQYELTRMDCLYHDIKWSESKQQLIFPFKADDVLVAWQARNFSPDAKTKWFSQGNLRELFVVNGTHPEREVVLVEDIVSSIKVGKVKNSLCLFGSNPPDDVLARIKHFYEKAWIWLDPDAHGTAMKVAEKLGKMGIITRVVMSQKDPKEHSTEFIKERLNG